MKITISQKPNTASPTLYDWDYINKNKGIYIPQDNSTVRIITIHGGALYVDLTQKQYDFTLQIADDKYWRNKQFIIDEQELTLHFDNKY